jgi:hypothetical protein
MVLTKTQAYVCGPMTEQMLWKKIRGKLELYSNKVLNLSCMTLPFNLDHILFLVEKSPANINYLIACVYTLH